MEQKKNLNEIIKQSQLICSSLIIGQLFFLAVAIFLVTRAEAGIGEVDLGDIFIFIIPIFAVTSIAASYFVFKNKLNRLKESQSVEQKLVDYRSAQIIRWALLEGPSFLTIIAFLLTGQFIFVGVVAIIIMFFIPTFPSAARLEQDLELTWDEKNKLSK